MASVRSGVGSAIMRRGMEQEDGRVDAPHENACQSILSGNVALG